MRKTQGIKESYYEIFKLYEYPSAPKLYAALETCEKSIAPRPSLMTACV